MRLRVRWRVLYATQLSEKCSRTRPVGQRRERPQNFFLTHGEPCTDRVGIDAYAFELLEQSGEPIGLCHIPPVIKPSN